MPWILQVVKKVFSEYWLCGVSCDRCYGEYQRNRRQDRTHEITHVFKIFKARMTGVEVVVLKHLKPV